MSVWHEPLGVDFSAALVAGLRARMEDAPPEAMAGVTLLLPTRRMQRRVAEMVQRGGAGILPRIALVSDLTPLVPTLPLPAPRSALALRLDLARLVDALLAARPDLAPRRAAFDLAESLGTLMEEMKEEGVTTADLDRIDAGTVSRHWQDSLAFLRIAGGYAEEAGLGARADIQSLCLDALAAIWAAAPPPGRVIVAGSTGSRAQTLRLMHMVAGLPDGDVILPGLDTDMPAGAWDALDAQDHPQYRHRRFLGEAGLTNATVPQWSDARPAAPARNALVSLALRPAPATDAWLAEGPALAPDLAASCDGLTLLEAGAPLEEAETIALRLRQAVEEGGRAALISPDRTLSRQVAACLDRWGLVPDDSAGRPLALAPPGRLLTQVARMRGSPVEAEALVALLKHPLTHSGPGRGEHLRRARDVELGWLRGGPLHPDADGLRDWAAGSRRGRVDGWTDWLGDLLTALEDGPARAGTLAEHAAGHLALAERIAAGSEPDAPHALWDRAAGRAAREVMDGLIRDAGAAGDLTLDAGDYARFLEGLLAMQEVREPDAAHPGVMIWGALEARVQGADLVILGGLNDGTWPGLPGPDMWLNRAMRAACGLRAPDRAVGLSAHDFQQAVAGPQVWLSRTTRSGEGQTVPSRWLNRLVSLLGGIGPQGAAALEAMRARGAGALASAALLRLPQARHDAPPAPRPAPVPPARARPDTLSVTEIERLIRDPYAIYARRILGLAPLTPLRPPSDPALRGIVVHDALAGLADAEMDETALMDALRAGMDRHVPDAATRALWLGRFGRIAGEFAEQEAMRRAHGRPAAIEEFARWRVPGTGFTLRARADRIDLRGDGVAIYDYKTGAVPSIRQQDAYAKQLMLEALMVEDGAFGTLGRRPVRSVGYLGIGGKLSVTERAVDDALRGEVMAGLVALIGRYSGDAPFPARLAYEHLGYSGDYDHLARHGEWDDTCAFTPQAVG